MTLILESQNMDEILNDLHNFHRKDFTFESGKILSSMCSQPHPIAIKAYIDFIETNLGDSGLFPGTKEIEKHLLSYIQNLLNAPTNSKGLIVSGGTEGNITAIWIAKQLSHGNEIIIPATAHFSFQKIASLMDMKLKLIPLNKKFKMNEAFIRKKISNNTAAIVGIAGSTDLGIIDSMPEISDICLDENIFFHVDAAFGGFIIPFLKKIGYNICDFDFTLDGVSSISIDAHKMGYSAIPLGSLIVRNKEWIDEISVASPCISSQKQTGILGTRSGGPVAAAYAVTRYLGEDGYKRLVKNCMEVTKYTIEKIQDIGLSIVTPPTMNVIAIKLNKLDKIENELEKHGWKVNKINHLSSIRIVCMPQITKNIIDEFIPILEKTCKKVGEL